VGFVELGHVLLQPIQVSLPVITGRLPSMLQANLSSGTAKGSLEAATLSDEVSVCFLKEIWGPKFIPKITELVVL
jgi:hypothetical protein